MEMNVVESRTRHSGVVVVVTVVVGWGNDSKRGRSGMHVVHYSKRTNMWRANAVIMRNKSSGWCITEHTQSVGNIVAWLFFWFDIEVGVPTLC